MKDFGDIANLPGVVKVLIVGANGGARILYQCHQCGNPFETLLSKVRYGQRWCSRHCRNEAIKAQLADRFWARIDKSGGPDACWIWTGKAHTDFGYGVVGVGGRRENGGRTEKAHRLAWILTFGPISSGLWVLHSCDNPLCCNPSHLFLGKSMENVADMKRKGRHAHGECSYAKLTEAQVVEIRQRYKDEKISQPKLAADYGVSQSMIGHIVKGVAWTHVA